MATDEQKMSPLGRAYTVIDPLGAVGQIAMRPARWVAGPLKRVPFSKHR